jgi:hypothetical protein
MKLLFPSGDPRLAELEVAAEVLNRFYWNVSVDEVDGEFVLRGGELAIASFESIDELTVFATGMALALSLLPPDAVEAIDQFAKE